jgi:protein-tyrosine phosphatase
MKQQHILFVCSGNICRSPLAEELLRRELESRGAKDRFVVHSVGTVPDHLGQQTDPRMLETAARHGVTLNHNARRLRRSDLERHDIVIGMDDWHMRTIRSLSREIANPPAIHKMLEYHPNYNGGQAPDVPDPWYGSMDGFERVYTLIEASCRHLADRLATREPSE